MSTTTLSRPARQATPPFEIQPFDYTRALRDDRELEPMTKLVCWTILARFPKMHIGMRAIADDSGLSKPTVIKHVRIALEKGWLRIARKGSGENPTLYRLSLPSIAVKRLNLYPDVQTRDSGQPENHSGKTGEHSGKAALPKELSSKRALRSRSAEASSTTSKTRNVSISNLADDPTILVNRIGRGSWTYKNNSYDHLVVLTWDGSKEWSRDDPNAAWSIEFPDGVIAKLTWKDFLKSFDAGTIDVDGLRIFRPSA
jgi:hypothetical protein